MGRKGNWLSSIKKVLSPSSKEKKNQKSKKNAYADDKSLEPPVAPIVAPTVAPNPPIVEPDNSHQIPPLEEVKPIEVEDEQAKHAYSVAAAAAAASQAAAAAAQAAAESVRLAELTRYSGKSKEEVAAIRIQTTFRGYLARRALRALRGLVRLKTLVEGPAVKRQTANTLKCMQNLSRVHSQINSRRIRMSEENQALQKQLLQKRAKEIESLQMGEEWNDSLQSKEEIEAKLLSKYEATMRRERAMAYSFSHQQPWKKSSRTTNLLFMDPTNPQWGWSWLERYMAARPLADKDHASDHASVRSGINITVGFWFSHMGWIFKKPHYPRMKLLDASDLNEDPVVRFQHKHYVPLALGFGLGLPTLIGALWGDALGGLLYGGVVARVIIWHATFCINSFAHWAGDQLYSNEISARGNLLLALITHGEGYHNFHHEFPKDFRNGYNKFDWDPSKWIIYTLHKLTDQVPSLCRVPDTEVRKARTNIELIKAQENYKKCNWGVDPSSLPVMTYEQYKQKQEQEGKEWILVGEFVLDVSSFKIDHPGGTKVLKNYYGKDSTKAFYGGLNDHSKAAIAMAAMLRVARIEKNEKEMGKIF